MKVAIYQDANGNPIVNIEGETVDRPEDVAKAYLETIKKLYEAIEPSVKKEGK